MPISHPRSDVQDALGIASSTWRVLRRDEQSRDALGRTFIKELGFPLWAVDIQTRPFPYAEGVSVEAIIDSLDGGEPFYLYDTRHPYPAAYPDGSFNDTGALLGVQNGAEIRLDSLDANFELRRGDWLAFDYGAGPSRALHRVQEDITADGAGVTGWFEVRPHLRPGYSTGDSVILKQPAMLCFIQPGTWRVNDEPPRHVSYSMTVVQSL